MYEPDFTNYARSAYIDFSEDIESDDQSHDKNNIETSFPLPEQANQADGLNPTPKDPRCDPNWPLAHLWPVYVGNFHCGMESTRDRKIRHYFASKGLLVRYWIFQNDFYHREFQIEAGLYDMLVYFESEADAQRAVECCYRDVLDGYKLNIFPGRDPVYFSPERTVHYLSIKSGHVFSEEFFERHFNRLGPKTCVVKFDLKVGAVEFENPTDVQKALRKDKLWNPTRVGRLQKQRFLERDLIRAIENDLANKPNALQLDENDPVVQMLRKGQKLHFDLNAHKNPQPIRHGPPKRRANTKKKEKYILNCFMKGKQPRCFRKDKQGKKQFKRLLNKMEAQCSRFR